MRNLLLQTLIFLVIVALYLFFPISALAQTCQISPSTLNVRDSNQLVTIYNAYTPGANTVDHIDLHCRSANTWVDHYPPTSNFQDLGNGNISVNLINTSTISGNCWVTATAVNPTREIYVIGTNGATLCSVLVPLVDKIPSQNKCDMNFNPEIPQPDQPYDIVVSKLKPNSSYALFRNYDRQIPNLCLTTFNSDAGGNATIHRSEVESVNAAMSFYVVDSSYCNGFNMRDIPTNSYCSGHIVVGVSSSDSGYDTTTEPVDICAFVPGDERNIKTPRGKCNDCFKSSGVFTPFGCIETDPTLFVQRVLQIAIGLAGGIAFLMIIYGGFVIMTSAGNPERLTSGKEIITSAIAGLLLIIFSVVILKIVGVDILQIPGLAS